MWGYHLTVDCEGCNDAIKDRQAVAAFAVDMVSALGMSAYGPAQIVRFGKDSKVAGITLVQLVETSNITAHFCDHTGEAYIDIFSCKSYSIADAIAVIQRHFEPTDTCHSYRERQAPVAARRRLASA